MGYEDILFEVRDGVAVITLNRPDRLNAFGGAMGREWGEAYQFCDSDDTIRVVVVTGAGRAFCAGADLGRGAATFDKPEGGRMTSAAALHPPAWEVRKPVIAAINGHAIGMGLTLALQCDIRIIAREGKYGIVQVRRGVMPDCYSHWTLPRIAGLANAADILLTGRMVNGDEAVQMGLASRVLPADEVLPAALEIARDIAVNTAPLSVAVTKRLLWESPSLTRTAVGRLEAELHNHLMGKPDSIEGVMAYLEKRNPIWQLSVKDDWPDWPWA